MNWKTIIGILIISLLISCSKDDVIYVPLDGPQNIEYINKELKDPENNTFKDFSKIGTKAMTPIWLEGDLVSIYSIDENNKVIFIDTCAVYDIGNVRYHRNQDNYARITAEVAKECKGYFAGYPYDILDLKKGDVVSFPTDRNFGHHIDLSRAHLDGTFGTASIMTGWCDWCEEGRDGIFNFRNRCALLQINNVTNKDIPFTIKLPDGLESTISTYVEDVMYFPIISKSDRNDKISIDYKGYYNVDITPKDSHFKYKIGYVYPYDIKSIRLTSLYIQGKSPMKPSDPAARFYCWGILGNNTNTKIDLSDMATWSFTPVTSGAIIYDNPGEIWFKKEAASSSTVMTATFGGFKASFTINNK